MTEYPEPFYPQPLGQYSHRSDGKPQFTSEQRKRARTAAEQCGYFEGVIVNAPKESGLKERGYQCLFRPGYRPQNGVCLFVNHGKCPFGVIR